MKFYFYTVAALLVFSVALLFLFGPSFGVIFTVCLIGLVIVILICRYLYIVTQRRLYRILYGFLSLSVSVFLVLFIMVGLFISNEYHAMEDVPEEVDYIIILGAGLKGAEPSNTLKERLDTGFNYLRDHSNVPVILSGGKGPGEHTTEADAMAAYLKSKGIEEERLILENRSRTTEENLAFSKLLMNKKNEHDLKILIITSDYHLFRAKQIAKETGYVIYGVASKSPGLVRINYTIRECFGVIQTFLKPMVNTL